MWTRAQLKDNAKIVMFQNYWQTVLVAFLAIVATGGSYGGNSYNIFSSRSSGGGMMYYAAAVFFFLLITSTVIAFSLVFSVFLLKPLEIGCRRYFISARQAPGNISLLSFGYKNEYMNIVKTQFLRGLFTFLWSLLFIVPGIIKAYEYRMMPYILAENPGMNTEEVFARSKMMMTGDKWDAFVLDLSFLGWHILGFFTCGLLNIFYVNPYQQSTNAELYEALRYKLDQPNPYYPQ